MRAIGEQPDVLLRRAGDAQRVEELVRALAPQVHRETDARELVDRDRPAPRASACVGASAHTTRSSRRAISGELAWARGRKDEPDVGGAVDEHLLDLLGVRVAYDDAALDALQRIEDDRHGAMGERRVHGDPEARYLARAANRIFCFSGEGDASLRVRKQALAGPCQFHPPRVRVRRAAGRVRVPAARCAR